MVLCGVYIALFKRRNGFFAHLHKGQQHVECVNGGWIDIHARFDSSPFQIFDIGQRLAIKRLAGSHEGICRGKTGIVRLACGRGIRGNILAPKRSKILFPGPMIAPRIPNGRAVVAGGIRIPVIEHRV